MLLETLTTPAVHGGVEVPGVHLRASAGGVLVELMESPKGTH